MVTGDNKEHGGQRSNLFDSNVRRASAVAPSFGREPSGAGSKYVNRLCPQQQFVVSAHSGTAMLSLLKMLRVLLCRESVVDEVTQSRLCCTVEEVV